jgi:hypothetical protein
MLNTWECEGHEVIDKGPIGNVEYCDGSCKPIPTTRAELEAAIDEEQPENGLTQYYRAKLEELDGIEQRP